MKKVSGTESEGGLSGKNDFSGKLKDRQDVQRQGIGLAWWAYLQIQTTYEKDKKTMGVYKEQTEFDLTFSNILIFRHNCPYLYSNFILVVLFRYCGLIVVCRPA